MLPAIALILSHALSAEAPTFENDIKYDHFRSGLNNLIQVDEKIVNNTDDNLINPEVDLAILSTIQLFESRLRPNPKDGDCYWNNFKINGQSKFKLECRSVGNMQISRGIVKWAKNILPDDLQNLSNEQMHDPETNTRLGYIILKNFKAICKSSLPGVWLTAYGEGKCPKNNQLDYEGIRRCAVLTSLLKANNILPDDWKCGHEGKKMKDKTALKFISKIEEYNNQKLAVEDRKN